MDTQQGMDDTPLSRRDAAKRIGVSLRTLDTLIAEGEIPYLRVRGRVLFDPTDLRSFLDKCRVGMRRTVS